MSADRWSGCPRCKQAHEAEIEKLENRISKSYGKVPQDQYLLMIESVRKMEDKELDSDLREDWELGTYEDGTFSIKYLCSCSRCGFSYTYKYEAKVL